MVSDKREGDESKTSNYLQLLKSLYIEQKKKHHFVNERVRKKKEEKKPSSRKGEGTNLSR